MPITVGCSDFNEPCEFRVTAGDGQEGTLVEAATPHALEHHNDTGLSEPQMQELIRAQIRSLLLQAHTSEMSGPHPL